ncbi:MAG: hypothetical protein FWH45_01070 [Methanomassiliicoccaceae archaeon]|nr:hypothetical protein [Methanomassiliicoccaceae archaeon]MCL2145759.1 hypothetical protein [Methanomassiliicoccaceae archaeon]
MAMIDIEYRHSSEPPEDENLRRWSIEEMSDYLRGLVSEMLLSDISSKFISTEGEGPNTLFINGKNITDILSGLDIKMLDSEESCDQGKVNIVSFGRPTLDWNKDVIEDIPDVLVKNAISKAYADVVKDRIL